MVPGEDGRSAFAPVGIAVNRDAWKTRLQALSEAYRSQPHSSPEPGHEWQLPAVVGVVPLVHGALKDLSNRTICISGGRRCRVLTDPEHIQFATFYRFRSAFLQGPT
jgi:hypothetical protein